MVRVFGFLVLGEKVLEDLGIDGVFNRYEAFGFTPCEDLPHDLAQLGSQRVVFFPVRRKYLCNIVRRKAVQPRIPNLRKDVVSQAAD